MRRRTKYGNIHYQKAWPYNVCAKFLVELKPFFLPLCGQFLLGNIKVPFASRYLKLKYFIILTPCQFCVVGLTVLLGNCY